MAGGGGRSQRSFGGSDRRHFTRMSASTTHASGRAAAKFWMPRTTSTDAVFGGVRYRRLRGQLTPDERGGEARFGQTARNEVQSCRREVEGSRTGFAGAHGYGEPLERTSKHARRSNPFLPCHRTEIQAKSAESRKLNRIRRVCRHVRARAELDESMEALGRVAELPKARDELNSAVDEKAPGRRPSRGLQEQIDSLVARLPHRPTTKD